MSTRPFAISIVLIVPLSILVSVGRSADREPIVLGIEVSERTPKQLVVEGVKPNSIGEQMGLRRGDVLHEVNGNKINSLQVLTAALKSIRVTLSWKRESELLEASAQWLLVTETADVPTLRWELQIKQLDAMGLPIPNPNGGLGVCCIWHARTTVENADDFERVFLDDLVKKVNDAKYEPGSPSKDYVGVNLLRRRYSPREMEFTILLRFGSVASAHWLAGADDDRPFLTERMRRALIVYDAKCQYYEVRF